MPRKSGTRLIAKQQLAATDEVNGLDYFGEFTKRRKLNNDSNNQGSTSEGPNKQIDPRAARIARRDAVKSGQTLEVRGQVVSPQQGTTQQSEEDDSEDDSETAAGEDGEDDDEEEQDEEEEGGHSEVDHAIITQAMNRARNRTVKPTINGIGSRRQERLKNTELSGDGEGSHEALPESQHPDGEEVAALPNENDRSRSRHGASGKAPQQKNQQGYSGRDRRHQKGRTNTSSPHEDESQAEYPSESDLEDADDSAFVEAPQQDERTITVKVVINSMGGILKTLRHSAWTGSTHWASMFESNNNDDGQKSCMTKSGKDLMNELQGLNDILEEATNPPEDPFDDGQDLAAPTAYLSTKSLDIQQHLKRISKTIDVICSRKLLPVQQRTSIKRRQALLRDMSCRLIPMLMITVRKACGICRAEDNRSKTSLYLDCFTIQFFLRPLAWADRLNRALERGIEQWPRGNESHSDVDDSQEGEHEALGKARFIFDSQLTALFSTLRKAEKEIQQIAEQAERQEREAEIKRQERERMLERQREIATQKQREQDEQDRKDEKAFQAFFAATRALRSQPDPLKQLWDKDQAALPEQLRATFTVRASQNGSSSGQGQRAAGAAPFQGGNSRNARVESVFDPDDPFLDNDGPRSNNPVSNRHASSNGVRQNPLFGLHNSQQARNEYRPWSDEEDKIMIRAMRYKRTYDAASMAQKLRRSEDDVARKAAFLKQGYREAFAQKGLDTPAWAL